MASKRKKKNTPQARKQEPIVRRSNPDLTRVHDREGAVFHIQRQEFSGPVPPPAILQAYGEHADRIVAMAEEQARHRQHLEKTVIQGDTVRSREGMILGFLIVMFAIGCGTYLLAIDKPVGGYVSIIGALVTLAGLFVYGSKQRRNEREAKVQQMLGKDE